MPAATIAVSLLLAGSVHAAVPRFKPKTIVPGVSIGGVKLGMTKAQAVAVWGKPDRCANEATAIWCQYVARSTQPGGSSVPPAPYAGFYLRAKKVIVVHLETPRNSAIDPKLKRIKTSKGIRLGSTMAAARRAYKLPAAGGGETAAGALYKQGKRCTMFYAPRMPYNTIDSISVGLCAANVGGFWQ